MNRLQIRQEVRGILRDDSFPKKDIDRAINRVVQRLNGVGRMRYHQDFSNVTMVTDDYDYTLDADIIAEDLVVFDPSTSTKPATLPVPAIVKRIPTLADAVNLGKFLTTGDVPTSYVIYMNELWIDPIPSSVTNGKVVRIYHYADVPNLKHDLDSPPARFNPRWHANILALGAAIDIGGSIVGEDASLRHIDQFNKNWRMMKEQEFWEPNTQFQLQKDGRWDGMASWGNVDGVYS